MSESRETRRLHLFAAGEDDLAVISSLMQDAAVKAREVAYNKASRRLLILANRFRWEAEQRSRIRCLLRVEHVARVQRRAWPASGETVLDLLAIRNDEGHLEFDFAGGPTLRAEAECIDIELCDLTGPWPTKRLPRHKL